MLNFLERSFWLSVLLLAGLAVLLAGTLARLGGGLPPLRPLQPQTGAPPRFFSADRAEDWFAAPLLARLAIPTNTVNPFYTLYFQPPPPPPRRPPRRSSCSTRAATSPRARRNWPTSNSVMP